MMERQPDILLFMSDQHAARYMGHEGGMVDTPNLDALAAQGTRFASHYTSCPLCVPARMSMLSSRLPTSIGVTANNHTLPDVTPTFLFPLVAAGYETVLIGRMHFVGKDLRHGFTKRIGGDMTPTSWVPPRAEVAEERGAFVRTFSAAGCMDVVGGGESPVRHYDREIVDLAISYLSQPHDKPQFILVGTFGPHFPYVANPVLYQKYKNRGRIPEDFGTAPEFVTDNPWLKSHQLKATREEAIRACAAYCALVEETDKLVGEVNTAFAHSVEKSGHPAIFGYISDHGDMAGRYNMYGKQVFFDDSARVPMLLTGTGIPAGRVVTAPTSIMDIGPTVCSLAGTHYCGNFVDGVDLTGYLQTEPISADSQRIVISQYIESKGGVNLWEAQKTGYVPEAETICYSAMARQGRWKYFFYHGLEDKAVLFDMEKDSMERVNLIQKEPHVAETLNRALLNVADPLQAENNHRDRNTMNRWLRQNERVTGEFLDERWKNNPPTARGHLEIQ